MTDMAQGRKTGGRQAGTPNKTTARLREAIEQAFEAAGGVEYLTRLARDEPRIFLPLLARLLPTSLIAALDDLDGSEPVVVTRIELVAAAPVLEDASGRPYSRAA
jgi:hypothetical protein